MYPNPYGLSNLPANDPSLRARNSKALPSFGGPVAQHGHGGMDWIAPLTGTLGAIGGGALGTLVAPGAGTFVGGVGGAAAGQALGQRIEDMLTGHQTTGGEMAGQAALGGGGAIVGGLVGKGVSALGGKLISKSPAAQSALGKLGSSKVVQTLEQPVFPGGVRLGLTNLKADHLIKQGANQPGNLALKEFGEQAGITSTRPLHQLRIEALKTAGDIPGATRVAQAIPEGDPYKQTMLEMLGASKGLPIDNLNTNAAGQVFAKQNGLPQPTSRPTSPDGKGAMDLFNSLKNNQKGSLDIAAEVPSKTGMSASLNRAAGRALADQYGTISKPLARATNPIKTFNQLSDAGLTKPAEVEAIAGKVTGANGIVNQAVVRAAGNASRVDSNGLRAIAKDAITNNGLVDANAKSVSNVLEAQMKILEGGPGGPKTLGNGTGLASIQQGAHPSDVLQVMKNLESRISDLKAIGGNYKLTDPTRLDQAKVLQLVHDELEDRLLQGAGANANLPKVLTPQLREQLVSLAPNNLKWANFVDHNVMKATSINQLRAAQRPFVNASKIINEGDINAMTFGGRMSNGVSPQGMISQIASPVLRPAQLAASSAVAPVERATASGLRGLANFPNVAKGAAGAAFAIPQSGVPAAGYQLGSLLARRPQDQPNQDIQGQLPMAEQYAANPTDPQFLGVDPAQFGYPEDPTTGSGMETQASPLSQLTPQLIEQLALADLQATGGKNMGAISALASISKITNPEPTTTKPKALSSTAATQLSNAQSGLEALDQMESEIKANPNLPLKNQVSSILGNLGRGMAGTQGYEAARKEAVDVLARMRTGAVINKSEEANFKAMLPSAYDSPQVAAQKLARYRSQFQNVIARIQSTGSPTLEDALGGQDMSSMGMGLSSLAQ